MRLLLQLFMGVLLMASDSVAADPNAALLAAARSGDLAAASAAIEAGADLEARDAKGQTALLAATWADQPAVARLLIERGADVNAKDSIDDSPYLLAGAEGRLDILKMTLEAGADLESVNRYGGTALIPAAERGHVETVRTLIKAGVKLDHVNRLGWTALLEAIILSKGGSRHQEIVKLLLEAGADPSLPDGEGVTPLAHARSRGYQEIVALLEAAGAIE